MKHAYKKNTSSLEILESSFGGVIPSVIELETPPNATVKIVEGNFVQDLIKASGLIRQSWAMYRRAVRQSLEYFKDLLKDTRLQNAPLIMTLSYIAASFIFLKLIKAQFEKPRDLMFGGVSPFAKDRMYLFYKNIQRENVDINQVINHENIHILQCHNGDFDFDIRLLERKRVNRYCELYLSADVKNKRQLAYLLEKVEVEARVHELISAFYIKTQHCPISRKEFLVCLFYSNDVLRYILIILKEKHSNSKIIMDLLGEIKKQAFVMSIDAPTTITTDVTEDFAVMFNSINNTDQLYNFISFELPSYYCNVLQLYGSNSASKKIRSEINKERQINDLK